VRRRVSVDGLQLPGEAVAVYLPFAAYSEVSKCFAHDSIVRHFAADVNAYSEEIVCTLILKSL
jgi:hypothetical protein